MASHEDIALMAHLMRRAGFGATHEELETLAESGYEETVEQLLHPEQHPDIDEYELYRYHPITNPSESITHAQLLWLYRMVNTGRPLQEKVGLFWHHVFATGDDKVSSAIDMNVQIQMFRDRGMGNFRDLLLELAKNPAMIFWLDNQENHKRAPNENWGRELMELFSLGVGNYTEKDVFECARAFTGWTIKPKVPGFPWGAHPWSFEYRPEDHDNSEKTFLGHTGNLNGREIIDIILQQPACPAFIMRHLYNFFVADEPEVPKWPNEPPRDPDAIHLLTETWVSNGFEMKPVLRVLFNADFFKDATYEKVRSPVEVVAGTLRFTDTMRGPHPSWADIPAQTRGMGQDLLNPPSVEGWHTGREWVNSGALINRVNFVADRVRDTDLPGVQNIVKRVAAEVSGGGDPAEVLVQRCLYEMGPLQVEEATRSELLNHSRSNGPVSLETAEPTPEFSRLVGELLALIAGTREYQFG